MLLENSPYETQDQCSGHLGSWCPAEAVRLYQPEPNSGLDSFELCRGMFLKSIRKSCGLEK